MKNKGVRYKRAEDALRKIHLDHRYTKGCVLSVTKSYPNFFTAMLFDSWSGEWKVCYCGYISTLLKHTRKFGK